MNHITYGLLFNLSKRQNILMDILDLIPQRPPMVMVDNLVSCDGPVAKGTFKVREDNVFLVHGRLSESGMIEALAQTAAARTGWITQSHQGVGKSTVPVGVIGSIKDFRLFFLPVSGDVISTEIEVMHEFMNASVVRGTVKVKDKKACDVELKIFLTESN